MVEVTRDKLDLLCASVVFDGPLPDLRTPPIVSDPFKQQKVGFDCLVVKYITDVQLPYNKQLKPTGGQLNNSVPKVLQNFLAADGACERTFLEMREVMDFRSGIESVT